MSSHFFNPSSLLGLDFYGFLLPWIFTFAIVYGLLVKANIFGGVNRQISIALAFVIAFFVTAVGGPQLASFFTNFFGGAATYLAGILVIILFLNMISGKDPSAHLNQMKYVVVLIVLGVLLFIGSSTSFGYAYFSSYAASIVFWLVIIVAAVWFVTKEKDADTSPPKE
jgi:Na+/serine symporter